MELAAFWARSSKTRQIMELGLHRNLALLGNLRFLEYQLKIKVELCVINENCSTGKKSSSNVHC